MTSTYFLKLGRAMFTGIFIAILGLSPRLSTARAENAPIIVPNPFPGTNSPAEKAWKQLDEASEPPSPPAAWNEKEPTPDEVAKFYLPELTRAANLARDFYTHYPADAHAADAKNIEYETLNVMVQRFGDTNNTARIADLAAKRASDPTLSEDDRLKMRFQSLQNLMAGLPATIDKLQAGALDLQKDFPKREEVFSVLLMVLSRSEGDKEKPFADKILASSVPDEVKTQVKILLRIGEMRPLITGLPATQDDLEKKVRLLQKDYPDRPEIYQLMLVIMAKTDTARAQALGKEILASSAPDEIKEQAKTLLERLSIMGQPVDIQFTAIDGRAVDLAKLKGKVVLVDFWATWCAPCMEEMPNVKAAYDKLHDKGFEIVGISFDETKPELEKIVKSKGLAWPQYFDGEGWKNKYALKFQIEAIPTMWLVDKKGNLRDLDAADDLEAKITKYLAEP